MRNEIYHKTTLIRMNGNRTNILLDQDEGGGKAAHSSSSLHPAGSNFASIERGIHHRFARFHHDSISEIQAHDTCLFMIWHRVYLLAYENMLRSLEPRFACLTIPFWDVYRDYSKQVSTTNVCRSYATCAKIINDLGGIVQNDDFNELTYFGTKVDGLWHFKSPVQNLRDDRNNIGLIRYDMWFDPIPHEVTILNTTNIVDLFESSNRVEFWEKLHHGIHDAIHDTIGGFMRTNASPIDPIFMPWHSTMDLFDYIWETCYYNSNDIDNDNIEIATNGNGNENGSNTCTYTKEARNFFPNISVLDKDDEVYMKLNNKTDIRDDPLIGRYFSFQADDMKFINFLNIQNLNQHQRFRYADIPKEFIDVLANNTQLCPNGLSSIVNNDGNKKEENAGPVVRGPTTFSSSQLESFKIDWIEQAQVYYNFKAAANNDTSSTSTIQQQIVIDNNNITFLQCLLDAMDYDTIERWAIDSDTFLIQVVKNKRYNKHPSCRDFLSTARGATPVVDLNQNNTSANTLNSNMTISSSSAILQGAPQPSFWFAILLIQVTIKLICHD
ncbi:tyrosinase [Fragilariopsis cylindrus CCMP1102]|uniref:Tyrosinase n=1 Tax=Fragilariopsis cylindrus CCMP1102 TaxID=635003 RepID=A0A1E7FM11_9STRA|nr:tyrosinase [Fragilariopsis cylindrus CCMP1102]|eukprot:OEU19209.1 tyrosinase [Fragilariopsis cylindrus CCMP1102]